MERRKRSSELVEQLAEVIVRERLEEEGLDAATLSFARAEDISHEIGRQVAVRLQRNFSETQAEAIELKNEFCCERCGLECECTRTPRRVQTISGPAEIIELICYCPRCRRSFSPDTDRFRDRT
jgi:hypothetical protein